MGVLKKFLSSLDVSTNNIYNVSKILGNIYNSSTSRNLEIRPGDGPGYSFTDDSYTGGSLYIRSGKATIESNRGNIYVTTSIDDIPSYGIILDKTSAITLSTITGASSDENITLSTYGIGQTLISSSLNVPNTSNSSYQHKLSSTDGSALQITGGTYIGKDLTVIGYVDITSATNLEDTLNVQGATTLNNSASITGKFISTNTTRASYNNSISEAAIEVSGGILIHENLIVDNDIIGNYDTLVSSSTIKNKFNGVTYIANTTTASPSNSALIVDGGVLIHDNLYIDNKTFINYDILVSSNTISNEVNGITRINNTTDVTSTTTLSTINLSNDTGAFRVIGGASISKQLQVGSNLSVVNNVYNNSLIYSNGAYSTSGTSTIHGNILLSNGNIEAFTDGAIHVQDTWNILNIPIGVVTIFNNASLITTDATQVKLTDISTLGSGYNFEVYGTSLFNKNSNFSKDCTVTIGDSSNITLIPEQLKVYGTSRIYNTTSSALIVDGNSIFKKAITVGIINSNVDSNIYGSLTITNTNTSNNTLIITGKSLLNNDLQVKGNVVINESSSNSLLVNGIATYNNTTDSIFTATDPSITINSSNSAVNILGGLKVTKNITSSGNLAIVGNTYIQGDTSTYGNVTFNKIQTIDEGTQTVTINGITKHRSGNFKAVTGSDGVTAVDSSWSIYNEVINTVSLFNSSNYLFTSAKSIKLLATELATNELYNFIVSGKTKLTGNTILYGNNYLNSDDGSNNNNSTIIGGSTVVNNTFTVGPYITTLGGAVSITDTSSSTSSLTGALKIKGGISTEENLYVAKKVVLNTNTLSTTEIKGITSLTNNTESSSYNNGTLIVTGGTGISGNLNVHNNTDIDNNLNVDGVTSLINKVTIGVSSNTGTTSILQIYGLSTVTGNLVVSGSTSIGGNTSITGITSILNNTSSTSTSNGALVVTGGVAVGNNINIVGKIYSSTSAKASGSSLETLGGSKIGGDLEVSKDVEINGTTDNNISYSTTINGITYITRSVAASSSTGSLIVSGGILCNSLYVTTTSTLNGPLTLNGSVTINNNLAVTGTSLLTNKVTVGATSNSFSTDILQIYGKETLSGNLVVSGSSTLSDILNVAGIVTITNNTSSTSYETGALKVTGGISSKDNLHIYKNVLLNEDNTSSTSIKGATTINNTLHTTGNVDFDNNLNIDGNTTVNRILTTNNNININDADIVAGTNNYNILTAATGTINQFADSSIYNINSKQIILTSSTALDTGYNFKVNGTSNILGSFAASTNVILNGVSSTATNTYTTIINGSTLITNTTESTSKVTGALKVSGGLGVSKNSYIGGNLNVTGTSTLIDQLIITDNTDVQIPSITDSLNTINCSITTAGGVYISKHLRTGKSIYVESTEQSTFLGSVLISDALTVNNNVILNDTSSDSTLIKGSASLYSTLSVIGATTLNNTLTIKGITTSYNIIPATDSTYNIGTNSVRYSNIYSDNLYGTLYTTVQSSNIYLMGVLGNSTGSKTPYSSSSIYINGPTVYGSINGTTGVFSDSLTSNGNTIIGNANTDTLTVTGPSTFTATSGTGITSTGNNSFIGNGVFTNNGNVNISSTSTLNSSNIQSNSSTFNCFTGSTNVTTLNILRSDIISVINIKSKGILNIGASGTGITSNLYGNFNIYETSGNSGFTMKWDTNTSSLQISVL